MAQHDDIIPDSTYPPLEPPGEFKSQIPELLLNGSSETDTYIMQQLSIMRQYSEWAVKAALSQDKNVRLTNGRLRRAEEDIKHLKGEEQTVKVGWKVIAKIAGAIIVFITLIAVVYQAFR